MITSEESLTELYRELGDKNFTDYDEIYPLLKNIFEGVCKVFVLFVEEYTWPFITGLYLIIASYVVYWRGV